MRLEKNRAVKGDAYSPRDSPPSRQTASSILEKKESFRLSPRDLWFMASPFTDGKATRSQEKKRETPAATTYRNR